MLPLESVSAPPFPCSEVAAGGGEGYCFFLAFGTAGKAPLLLEVGRAMIGSVSGTTLAGGAKRLLDSSRSLRRATLTRLWIFWMIRVSYEVASLKHHVNLSLTHKHRDLIIF